MNKFSINLKDGISCSKPCINKFSSDFDIIEFLLDSDDKLSQCTFAVVYSICGETGMDIDGGGNFEKTVDNNQIILTWLLGTNISCDSGVVIYQIVAYTADDNGTVSTVWYSPQGRIAVGESVDTTEYETMQIAAQPSLVAQFITSMDVCEKNISDLDSKCSENEKNISDLDSKCSENEKNISDLDSKCSENEKNISDLNLKCNENKTNISSLQTEVDELSQDVSTVFSDVGLLSEKVNTNADSIILNTEEISKVSGRVDNVELDVESKVDKQEGKGLSTEDFTTYNKQQLSHLSAFFKQIPEGKSIDDLSDIGDAGYYLVYKDIVPYILIIQPFIHYNEQLQIDVQTVCQISISSRETAWKGVPMFEFRHIDTANGNVWTSWEPYFASDSEVNDIKKTLENKIDKEAGKQLSTEDFTSGEKQQLSYFSGYFKQMSEGASIDELTDNGCYLIGKSDDAGFGQCDILFVVNGNYIDEEDWSDITTTYQIKFSSDDFCYKIEKRYYGPDGWTAWEEVFVTKSYVDIAISKTKKEVVLADFTLEEDSGVIIVSLSDNAYNYRKLLIWIQVPSATEGQYWKRLYNTDSNKTLGIISHMNEALKLAGLSTYTQIDFFKNYCYSSTVGVVNYQYNSTARLFSYPIDRTKTANAIRLDSMTFPAGTTFKVEAIL